MPLTSSTVYCFLYVPVASAIVRRFLAKLPSSTLGYVYDSCYCFFLLTKQPDHFSVFFLPDGAMASGAQRK